MNDAWRRARPALALLAGVLAAGGSCAQTWVIAPTVSLKETYSDNVAVIADELARRGWITDVTPGIRIDHTAARAAGFLDYKYHYLRYSSLRGLDKRQQSLTSRLNLEAVERFLFLDARADITQQNRSPFAAAVAPDQPSASSNRVETRLVQVSPYVSGDLFGLTNYRLRYTATDVRSEDLVALPRTRIGEFTGRFRNAAPSAALGWAIDVNTLSVRNDVAGSVEDSRIRGSLIYAIYPQLHVFASDGYERTDFLGPTRKSSNTPGVGLDWVPTPRTKVGGVYEKRFFGDGHLLNVSHRTAYTSWQFSSSRDATILPGIVSSGAGAVYILMNELLAATFPDPATRATVVRSRLDAAGLPGGLSFSTGSVDARPILQRSHKGSVGLLLPRDTITFGYSRIEQHGFGSNLSATLVANDYRQQGFSANWAHQMTPLTSLTLLATSLRTEGLTTTTIETRQRALSLLLTTRLGPKTSAAFGIRHVEFDSTVPLSGYHENAIFGSMTVKM